jgi:hypothetical protein
MGFGIYLFFHKLSRYKHLPNQFPEVTVIVQCKEEPSSSVIDEMWKYGALAVGKNSVNH